MKTCSLPARLLILFLLLAYFAQGLAQITHASLTFDEGPHLAVGYATLRTGDFRLQPVHIHPPLANVLAAAPLLLQNDLPDPRTIDGWKIGSLSAITDELVWQYPHPRRISVAGRVPILLLGVLLGALSYRWSTELGGQSAGLLALALFAFDPNLIAHGALITTDMAAVCLSVSVLYSLWKAGEWGRRQALWLVGAGVLLGLAQLAKVSALMLVPVVGLLVLWNEWSRAKQEAQSISELIWHLLRSWTVLFLTMFFIVWAGYGFQLASIPGLPIRLPAGTHVQIFQALREHYDLGHPTFLLGRLSKQGWWWYFPTAFVLKTPLPTLMLILAAVWSTCSRRRNKAIAHHQALSRWLPLVLFPVLYAGSALFSTVNIGYRHLLPLLPFLYVILGQLLANSWSQKSKRPIIAVLLLWLSFGTLNSIPYPLTFFNELAGGPENGYRSLVDSNLDWGQNLWDLKQWMAENGYEHVRYAHYSPARPAAYGIDADFLPPDPRAVEFTPWRPELGLYAIGATVLQGPYAPDRNTYAWFRAQEPTARLGNALFIYAVPEREKLQWIDNLRQSRAYSARGGSAGQT